jgi:hypothetical protein
MGAGWNFCVPQVLKMNLVPIGVNEFLPQLVRLIANERLSLAKMLAGANAFEIS